MNYRNSAHFLQSLSSEYHGPRILNFAGNVEEEEETEETEEEETEVVTPPEGEEVETEETETEEETGEEDEDPLETPNPFEEGSAQHQAFEKQREKFRTKLEKETKAAGAAAAGDISGKLDQLISALTGKAAPAAPKADPAKPAPKVKLTEEDRAIVTGVLSEIGLDPEQIVRERRRAEVAAACADLRKNYPDAEFDDTVLVKFANETGISKMGGPVSDILELALVRMQRTAKKPAAPAPAKPAPKKKEAPPINGSSTKKSPPSPEDDKPTTMQSLKDRILKKRGAK